MREEHQLWLPFTDQLLQRKDIRVGGIGSESRAFQCKNYAALLGREFGSQRREALAGKHHFDRPARFRGNALRSGNGFKGDAVEFAFALFGYDENCVRHADLIRYHRG